MTADVFKSFRDLGGWVLAIAIAAILGINYLNDQGKESYVTKEEGAVLVTRLLALEKSNDQQDDKLDTIVTQNTDILVKLGEIRGEIKGKAVNKQP